MKMHHFIIIGVMLFAIVFWIATLKSQNTVAASTSNRDYSQIITVACHDAIKTINTNKTYVFANESERIEALGTFYKSLLKGLKKDNGLNDEIISEKTPFVLLIDNDGFYLSYNTAFDTEMTLGDTDKLNACTALNTWATTISGYNIRFYLNDYIQVVEPSGIIHYGPLEEVKKHCTLPLLHDTDKYAEEKRYCIVRCIEDEINYMLNTQRVGQGSWRMGYSVELAGITGEDWTRMLKRPTIIGFLQGPSYNNMAESLNIYGYAAAEETKGQMYYAENGLYYKADRDAVPITETTFSDNGKDFTIIEQTENNISNMKDIAQKGNDPDLTAHRQQDW